MDEDDCQHRFMRVRMRIRMNMKMMQNMMMKKIMITMMMVIMVPKMMNKNMLLLLLMMMMTTTMMMMMMTMMMKTWYARSTIASFQTPTSLHLYNMFFRNLLGSGAIWPFMNLQYRRLLAGEWAYDHVMTCKRKATNLMILTSNVCWTDKPWQLSWDWYIYLLVSHKKRSSMLVNIPYMDGMGNYSTIPVDFLLIPLNFRNHFCQGR